MAKQVLNNGDSWASFRSKLNSNFTELYDWKVDTTTTVNGQSLSGNVTLTQDNVADWTTYKQYSQTEKTKLAWIATGATANSPDATLLARANHTGTQSADTITDGTTNKAFLATERTKLAGIATGATANDTDANLKNRANHTGTQLASTISDFNDKSSEALWQVNYENTWFKNNTDRTATTTVTMTWDDWTRTLTLTPNPSYDFWYQWIKFTKSWVLTSTIPNVTGGHFIYFDNTGTLVNSTTPWNLLTTVPVCFVYWNATLWKGIPYEERHWNTMDWMTHAYLHATNGTKYLSWLSISGYTINTDWNAAVTWSTSSWTISDEDLVSNISALADGWPYTILERSWASWDWTWTTTNTVPYLQNGTDIQYNQFTGWVWTKTAITANNRWVNYYVVVVPSITTAYQIVIVPWQTEHTSEANATAETFGQLSTGTLPFEENVVLYKITMRHWIAFTSTWRVQITNVADVKSSSVTINQTATQDHWSLLDLLADDHTQYKLNSTSQTTISTTPYTFTGTETRNGVYFVNTGIGNITVNLNADLFSTWYEVTITKTTADANTVIIDAQTWNTINGSQTYTLTTQNETVTLVKDWTDAWRITGWYSVGGWVTDASAIHDNVAWEIAAITTKATPVSWDFLLIEDSADSNNKKKITVWSLPWGWGWEANTASNVWTAWVWVFKQKTGVDLEFKKINAGSNKVTITDDTVNNEVDIDIAEANIVHQNLSWAGTNTHATIDSHLAATNAHWTTGAIVWISDTQTLTNKTIALGSNTVSGTKAEFDTAVSDGTICYDWDAVTNLTMSTARLLGRSTAATGAVEEITLWTNLSFTWTTLNATWGGTAIETSVAQIRSLI